MTAPRGATAAMAVLLLTAFAATAYRAESPHPPAPPTVRIDLNRAPAGVLRALPGIGRMRAEAIVRERERAGAFGDVAALETVPGLGPVAVRRAAPYVEMGE